MNLDTVVCADALDWLRTLPDESVNCIITSPPYYGLRDYGADGQLGLEDTPEAYVARLVEVFREARRVLRADGVVFLNLGDSYAGSGRGPTGANGIGNQEKRQGFHSPYVNVPSGLKPKDLIGIPWMVAKALQQPYYTGRIRSETDRAWLAGWLDGEGTISFVERDRGPNHTPTHDVRVFFTNTDRAPMDYFSTMTSGHVYQHENGKRENRFGDKPCYRWQMGTHDAALLLRELYPYLRTKRRQAALVWTLYTTLRHRNGHARTPAVVVERRREIASMVRTLNDGGDVTLPSWVEEPPSATEPGWWLRSDIIWAKPNPMPESVRDRPTKAHEYVFMLTRAARYWYDAEAVSEQSSDNSHGGGQAHVERYMQQSGRNDGSRAMGIVTATRNRRSVWTVATEPTPFAHFATFPQKLIEPMVLAGCPARVCATCGAPWERMVERGFTAHDGKTESAHEKGSSAHRLALLRQAARERGGEYVNERKTVGWEPTCSCQADISPGVVCDPFMGSGTTALVARQLGRHFLGCDVNAEYVALANERLAVPYTLPMFV